MSDLSKFWKIAGALMGAAVVLLGFGTAYLVVSESMKPPAADAANARAFEYDVKALQHVDEAMIKYAEESSFSTGFDVVGGMSLAPDGTIWVAGDSAARSFSPDGTRKTEIRASGPARCVAVDEGGNAYVGVSEHIEVYAADGARTASWPTLGPNAKITAIEVSTETVYVADAGSRALLRCDRFGKVLATLGKRDDAKKNLGLVLPSPYLTVAHGQDGLLYTNNPGRHRIEGYAQNGDLEVNYGQPSMGLDGFCGCCNPIAVALHPSGGFVTSEKGIARVKILNPTGKVDCVVAGPASFKVGAFAQSVAVDAKERIVLLDNGARTVRIFSRKKEQGASGK